MFRFGVGQVQAGICHDKLLSTVARWRIGGKADTYVIPRSTEDVSALFKALHEPGHPIFVMGDGTNMLIDSNGFRGVVMRIGRALGGIRPIGDGRIVCGAGAWVPELALRLARLGLTGVEHIVGIPGTIGGLVVMNGGSQQKGVGAHVRRVTVVDRRGNIRSLSHDELNFSYRQSALQGSELVVTEVELELGQGRGDRIRREMIEILRSRKAKFPKHLPNCGSTFLSNPAMYSTIGPPGRAIEEAGLKGASIGGAQVSPLHANFIVNTGTATSDDVLALIYLVRERVFRRTGFLMDCEVRYLSQFGDESPAHEVTDKKLFDTSLLDKVVYPNV